MNKNCLLGWCKDSKILVELIGVNKGRHVTLKYCTILINVNRNHRVYKGHEQSTSLKND